jgi:hypothetical protein
MFKSLFLRCHTALNGPFIVFWGYPPLCCTHFTTVIFSNYFDNNGNGVAHQNKQTEKEMSQPIELDLLDHWFDNGVVFTFYKGIPWAAGASFCDDTVFVESHIFDKILRRVMSRFCLF